MKLSYFALFVALILKTSLAFSAAEFEQNFDRYIGKENLFRLLAQKFPYIAGGEKTVENDCTQVTEDNAAFLSVPLPSSGNSLSHIPGPGFVKWYSNCIEKYISNDLNNAFKLDQTKVESLSQLYPLFGKTLMKVYTQSETKRRNQLRIKFYTGAADPFNAIELLLTYLKNQKKNKSREDLRPLINADVKNFLFRAVGQGFEGLSNIVAPETTADGTIFSNQLSPANFSQERVRKIFQKLHEELYKYETAPETAVRVRVFFKELPLIDSAIEYLTLLKTSVDNFLQRKGAGPYSKRIDPMILMWGDISVATQKEIILHSIHRLIGVEIVEDEPALLEKVFSFVDETKNTEGRATYHTLREALSTILYVIAMQDEFLRY